MSEQLPAVQPEKKQLAPVLMGSHAIAFKTLDDVGRFTLMVHQSGMAPRGLDTPQKIAVALMCGMEAGLSPMQAIQSVAVINGRPTMWGDAVLGLCSANPEFQDIQEDIAGEGDNMQAACCVSRKGRTKTLRTFSVADAKLSGLWKKAGPWTQYPQRMLQMRARAFALRDAFADTLKGIRIREEELDIRTSADPKPAAPTIEFPDVPESVAPTFQLEGSPRE